MKKYIAKYAKICKIMQNIDFKFQYNNKTVSEKNQNKQDSSSNKNCLLWMQWKSITRLVALHGKIPPTVCIVIV